MDDTLIPIAILFIIAAIFLSLGYDIENNRGIKQIQKEAVDKNYAKFTTDGNEIKFEWIEK